jgi:hypothetical protein
VVGADRLDAGRLEPARVDAGGEEAQVSDAGPARCRRLVLAGALPESVLVEAVGRAFGSASAVAEDERRAVAVDLARDIGDDRVPEGVAGHLAEALDRHHDAEVERLWVARVDDRDRALGGIGVLPA